MPTVLQYPSDLGTDPSLQHYVMFMINVRATGGAQYPGTAATGTQVVPGGAGGQNRAYAGINNVGQQLGTALQKTGLPRDLAGSNQLVRLDTVIALHIEDPPQTSYQAKYDNTELGAMGQMAQILGGNQALAQTSAMQSAAEHALGLATRAASTVSKTIANPEGLAAITKVRMNAYKQTYFDEMDFRMHEFRYRFMPKTEAEAMDVKRIVDLFKFHMHPELSSNTAFIIFPSEFDIMYFYAGDENRYWHRITSCVLTDVTVRYGGEVFATFPKGIPSEVNLALRFKETEVLNKERILQGY